MPLDDLGDASHSIRQLRKDIDRLQPVTGGDSTHAGAGEGSIQLGLDAVASHSEAVAIGEEASASASGAIAVGAEAFANDSDGVAVGADAGAGRWCVGVGGFARATGIGGTALGVDTIASADHATALGFRATASHLDSTAIGTLAVTTATNQVMLGTAVQTVVVPGTFSNPSARRMKQNITPAPHLHSIFPTLYEWEYIGGDGRRHIGPMADDLVRTDAERFVQFDDDGEVAGIASQELHTVQIAELYRQIVALRAEIAALKNDRG